MSPRMPGQRVPAWLALAKKSQANHSIKKGPICISGQVFTRKIAGIEKIYICHESPLTYHLWTNAQVTPIKGFTHIQACPHWNAVAIKEFPRTWNYRLLMPNRPSGPKGFGLPYKLILVLKSSQSSSWGLEVLSISMISRERWGEPSLRFSHKVAGRISGSSGLGEQCGRRV